MSIEAPQPHPPWRRPWAIVSYLPAVSSVAKRTLSVREVWGSIPGPVKSAQCRQRLAIVSSKLCSPGAKPRRWAPQLVTRFGVIRRV